MFVTELCGYVCLRSLRIELDPLSSPKRKKTWTHEKQWPDLGPSDNQWAQLSLNCRARDKPEKGMKSHGGTSVKTKFNSVDDNLLQAGVILGVSYRAVGSLNLDIDKKMKITQESYDSLIWSIVRKGETMKHESRPARQAILGATIFWPASRFVRMNENGGSGQENSILLYTIFRLKENKTVKCYARIRPVTFVIIQQEIHNLQHVMYHDLFSWLNFLRRNIKILYTIGKAPKWLNNSFPRELISEYAHFSCAFRFLRSWVCSRKEDESRVMKAKVIFIRERFEMMGWLLRKDEMVLRANKMLSNKIRCQVAMQ